MENRSQPPVRASIIGPEQAHCALANNLSALTKWQDLEWID